MGLIRVVDDFLISVPRAGEAHGERTVEAMQRKYGKVTYEWDPTSYVGWTIVRKAQHGPIMIHMAPHVEQAAKQFMPWLLTGEKNPRGRARSSKSLQKLADEMTLVKPAPKHLSPSQKRVQQMTGYGRYYEASYPRVTLPMHRLSCVNANPPQEATEVAEGMLEMAFEHRFQGLTYGGAKAPPPLTAHVGLSIDLSADRAPAGLLAMGDASWTTGLEDEIKKGNLPPIDSFAQINERGDEYVPRDLYSVIILYNGAVVFHQVKKVAAMVDCSMGAEAIASAMVSEKTVYAKEFNRALGQEDGNPTIVGTDNLANFQVAMRKGTPARAKHLLRRYYVLMERIKSGSITLKHVRDADNAADFLTKWVDKKKLTDSLRYVTGAQAG